MSSTTPGPQETATFSMPTPHPDLLHLARSVRRSQRILGSLDGARRSEALRRLAALLETRSERILAANARDLEAAAASNLEKPLLKRLSLDRATLATLRDGALQLAAQPDPLGETIRHTLLDDGLTLRQVRSPLGVLLVIFESRPDVVVQIASLALRAGDGVILKGGSEAQASNRVLVACLRDALASEGLPTDAVALVEGRKAVAELLTMDESIDLVIPRGSGHLVRAIQSSTRIPVLGHADGICHLYLDTGADPAMASRLAVDGKCDYPAACNATETLLVHVGFLPHLPPVAKALVDAGVRLRACQASRSVLEAAGFESQPAADDDWRAEYGDLTLAIRVVDGLDEAVDHIHGYGSAHTEAIVTQNEEVAQAFLRRIDSASVFWNASTRFADGYRYGLGAEVGIATGRIHARGPVGVEGLLTTRWLLAGEGHAAADYGDGLRSFRHRPLPLSETRDSGYQRRETPMPMVTGSRST